MQRRASGEAYEPHDVERRKNGLWIRRWNQHDGASLPAFPLTGNALMMRGIGISTEAVFTMKSNKHWLAFALLLLAVSTSGCISIEQEIFLQPDGSGDLLLHIGLPDMPEDAKKSPGGGGNPAEAMEKFKREVVAKLPPTVKLINAKETKRNGTQGFYAVFHFQDVREVQKLMVETLKESTEGSPGSTGKGKPPEWTLKYSKQGGVTNFSQLFFADVSNTKVETGAKNESALPPKTAARKGRPATRRKTEPTFQPPTMAPGAPHTEFKMEGMENLESLMLTIIKFRFVLHTPTPIKESNADFVINNGKSALWDCSLAAFAKEKKPIEMKASF